MPDTAIQTEETAPLDNGTSADKPLNTSVADKLGKISEEKLASLLRRSLSNEPAQAPAPDTKAESTSEESTADAEATEDKTQATVEETSKFAEVEQSTDAVEEGLPKGAQKRIDKLTALRKEAEAKATQLEAQIADLRFKLETKAASVEDAPIRSTPDNPYLHLQSQAEVDSAFAEARKVRRWCEENADGATVKDKVGKETDYSAEDVRRIKLNALDALEEHLPKQLKYVNTRSQIDPMAESEYQCWKDRTSREYAVAQNMLTAFPELRKFPDYKMVIGDYIRGAAQRENNYAAQKAGAAKAPLKKAPVQPTRSTSSPASVTAKERDAKNAEAKFRKTATTSNLKDLLLQQFL
jgi:hypothetical protein